VWKRRRGLTLVELLVVFTILTILAALLLPMLSGAQESARQVVCQNNLKELGVTLTLYAESFRGWQPYRFGFLSLYEADQLALPPNFGRWHDWNMSKHLSCHDGYLQPNCTPSFLCPSGEDAVVKYTSPYLPTSNGGRFTPGNMPYPDRPDIDRLGYINNSYSVNGGLGTVRDSAIRNPTKYVRYCEYRYTGSIPSIVGDGTWRSRTNPSVIPSFQRHSVTRAADDGRAHFLYQDGHVRPHLLADSEPLGDLAP